MKFRPSMWEDLEGTEQFHAGFKIVGDLPRTIPFMQGDMRKK